MRFKLMQNGETVYTFPARYEDDILQGQEFAGVAAVRNSALGFVTNSAFMKAALSI